MRFLFIFLFSVIYLLAVDPPHDFISCRRCHMSHRSYGSPLLADSTAEALCRSCHNPLGIAEYVEKHSTEIVGDSNYGMWDKTCVNCHDPHKHNSLSFPRFFIKDSIYNDSINANLRVIFSDTVGQNSYADGDSIYTGVCEVCHTKTKYHRFDGSAPQDHHPGERCTNCHIHLYGFKVPNYECLTCHSRERGKRRDIAKDFNYPDLSSGVHHPLTYIDTSKLNTPSLNNCIICHLERGSEDTVYHQNGVIDFVYSPDDVVDSASHAEWRGSYPSWWCLDCHDNVSPGTLGSDTASNKRYYYDKPSTHYSSPSSSSYTYCGDCHTGGPNAGWGWFPQQSYRWGSNIHTGVIGNSYYSMGLDSTEFVSSNREEAVCYDCHGGGMNSRRYNVNPPVWQENIKVAFSGGPYGKFWRTKPHLSDFAQDKKVVCRLCHDPHKSNRYQNSMLVHPDNPDSIFANWNGNGTTPDEFCNECHDGSQAQVPSHSVPINGKKCIDCHLVHGSTQPFLQYLSDSELVNITVNVDSDTVYLTVSDTFNFTGSVLGLPDDRIIKPVWEIERVSGGFPGYTYEPTDVPVTIPDPSDPPAYMPKGGIYSEIYVPDSFIIEDVNLWIDISHSYAGDLVVQLEHVETGKKITVIADNPWDWNPFSPRFFDTEAESNGSYLPVEDLNAFKGENAKGIWRLYVIDTWNGAQGTLNNWRLHFNQHLVGKIDSTGKFIALYPGSVWVYYTVHSGRIVAANPTGSDWWNLKEPVRKDSVFVVVSSIKGKKVEFVRKRERTCNLPLFHREEKNINNPKFKKIISCQKCHS